METRTKFTSASPLPNLSSLPSLTTTTPSTSLQTPSPNSTTPSPTATSCEDVQREARILRLYGHLSTPPRRFASHLKSERKYFDSGDYALSKAGKGDGVDLGAVGTMHPEPERIPHPFGMLKGGGKGGDGGQGGQGGKEGHRRKSSLSV